MPFPDISASEPSALKMRIRTSARLGRRREDQAVGADAEMPVADRPGKRDPVAIDGSRVDDDEVVTGPVEFGEIHAPEDTESRSSTLIRCRRGSGRRLAGPPHAARQSVHMLAQPDDAVAIPERDDVAEPQ